MGAYRVLVSCPLIQDDIGDYADRFAKHDIEYDVPDIDQQLTEAELLEIVDQYDGVIAGDDQFTGRVLRSANRLRVISKWGIGTDDIDLGVAQREGIDVYNTPGAFKDEVADVVIGYAIMLTRRLHHIDRAVQEGKWYCPRGVSLAGKTFGIVGVGSIGSAVARRAHALGTELVGHDVEPFSEDLIVDTGIEPVDPGEVFERSTVVSLNCPLTEQTHHMVGGEELDALGGDGYLINTARGGLVDQEELVDALSDGRVAGAALDVYEDEPLPADSLLTEMEDVILGSHNSQNTHEAVAAVNDRAVENLLDGLDVYSK